MKDSVVDPRPSSIDVRFVLPALAASSEVRELLDDLLPSVMAPADPPRSTTAVARALRSMLGKADGRWEAKRLHGAREALDSFLRTHGVDDDASPVASIPVLLSQIAAEPHGLALTFAGQANAYLPELTGLYRASRAVRRLIDSVADRLTAEVQHLTPPDRAFFGEGLDVRGWVDGTLPAPSDVYLQTPAVSLPLILATQMAHYVRLLEAGYDHPLFWQQQPVLAGHSQGVVAAVIVSETWGQSDVSVRTSDFAACLLFQGLRMQQVCRVERMSEDELARVRAADVGEPSPMAGVNGLLCEELQAVIDQRSIDAWVSLENGRTRHVLSGQPRALEQLRLELAQQFEQRQKAKRAGHYGGRLQEPQWQYLPVTMPFHSPWMAKVVEATAPDVARMGLEVSRLRLPVLDTATGEELQPRPDLVAHLVDLQSTHTVRWWLMVRNLHARGVRDILDFGPGEGVMKLTSSIVRGCGMRVLSMASASGHAAAVTSNPELAPEDAGPAYEQRAPTLMRTGETLRLENCYTRFTGCAPVILPGMTPTTVDADIVVAAANGGFVAELAGGGQVTETILRRRLDEVAAGLTPGRGIVLNTLYLDPYLWKLHLGDRLLQRLRGEGYPIVGVTISAGIPPVDEAVALLRDLNAHGLWLNSFKVGDDAQIQQVLAIADACPEHTFCVHLEGGHAGGHHSWEDLDDLLSRHYGALASRENLVLAVGGGIGTEEQASRYLFGEWSLPLGLPRMPVDAVFVGTAAMCTREARTSAAVKRALVTASGASRWILDGERHGGVTSGRSQLDASIYYFDNHASRVARLLDEVVKAPETIPARKAEIAAALDKTAKPYFGDLETMSCRRFLERLVELGAVGRSGPYEDGPWLDGSHRSRCAAMIWAIEARLAGVAGHTQPVVSCLPSESALDDPHAVLARLFAAYPTADDVRLHPDDAALFLTVCRSAGKPVNFVPTIDADVRRWYKADSLWQAHDDRFTADQVLAIPGPVALAAIKEVDEPVCDLLGRFARHAVSTLEQAQAPVPVLDESPLEVALRLPDVVLDGGTTSATRLASNPMRRLFTVEPGQELSWHRDTRGAAIAVELRDADQSVVASARLGTPSDDGVDLAVTLWATHARERQQDGARVGLDLGMRWDLRHECIRWDRDLYVRNQASFYGHLLFAQPMAHVEPFAVACQRVTVDASAVAAFAQATEDDSAGLYVDGRPNAAPLNMAFALSWAAQYQALTGAAPDMLSLLHEQNRVTTGPGWPVRVGQTLDVQACIEAIEVTPQGRRVTQRATLSRDGVPAAVVESVFLIRGQASHGGSFESHAAFTAHIELADAAAMDLLVAQPWLTLEPGWSPGIGQRYEVQCSHYVERRPENSPASFEARGVLLSGDETVAHINLRPVDAPEDCRVHPVGAVCALLRATDEPVPLQKPRLVGTQQTVAPRDMAVYAHASGDFNPLHLEPQVARLAGLQGPVVHGMWTASVAAHGAIRLAAAGDLTRLSSYDARFLAPVSPGEVLATRVTHVAMRRGGKVVQLQVTTQRNDAAATVLSATAEIAPPRTVYLFPGQGVQQRNMGMDGYGRSSAARAVWDAAEQVCRDELGFSILRVVRENPDRIWVNRVELRHPKGVLYLTRFTQVALTVMGVAQAWELQERGALVEGAFYCGHSIGEYAALAAIARVLPLEAVVPLVYHRGRIMDDLVERDSTGRSPYGMGVVRPRAVGLSDEQIQAVVDEIAARTGLPLEIVNYNIRGRQYSVTGNVRALEALRQKMSELQGPRAEKPAYIEVPGIDVPFHSTLLRGGVKEFRQALDRAFPVRMDHRVLMDRYIPNLVARPFRLDRPFIEHAHEVSGSPIIAEILARSEPTPGVDLSERDALARQVLIELLSYQFTSPVRWIETQEHLFFGEAAVEQAIEIGLASNPVGVHMARATLADGPRRAVPIVVLNSGADFDAVVGASGSEEDASAVHSMEPAAEAPIQAPARVVPSPTPGGTPEPQLVDEAPTVREALWALLALLTRLRADQIKSTDTLDGLLGGNSARRNQVLADVGAEFGLGSIDGAHEMPLGELASAISARTSQYRAPGKYLRGAMEQAATRALGASGMGAQDAQRYLSTEWSLGPGSTVSVFLHLAQMARDGDSSRGGPLSDRQPGLLADLPAARGWLDAVVQSFGATRGLSLQKPTAGAAGGATQVDSAALTALEQRILGPDGVLARATAVVREELNLRDAAHPASSSADSASPMALDEELGADHERALRPIFVAEHHVALTASWAWGKRDVITLAQALREGERPEQTEIDRLHRRLDPGARRTATVLAARAEREGRLGDARILYSLAEPGQQAGRCVVSFVPTRRGESTAAAFVASQLGAAVDPVRLLGYESGSSITAYAAMLHQLTSTGLSFEGRTALVTGASPGSIAFEVVRLLLAGGARVIATTTHMGSARRREYRAMYQSAAAPGAELHLVPANLASFADIDNLVRWAFGSGATSAAAPLPSPPDILLPFAASSELVTLREQGGATQNVLRVLLLGVERLIARMAQECATQGLGDGHLQVVLPLSPNHGTFGGDGVYGESKAALEVLLNRWRSEHRAWGRHVCLVGARIGWVRGTGLMAGNDLLAARIEEDLDVRTYAADEMALLLTALLSEEVRDAARTEPLVGEMTGRLGAVADFGARVGALRDELQASRIRQRRFSELSRSLRESMVGHEASVRHVEPAPFVQLAPPIPDDAALASYPALDHLDPSQTVVIVGYGEVGPWGSARTRWQMESRGVLSLEAALELAWMMGLIRPRQGGVGWENVTGGDEISPLAVKARYEDQILGHCGIRIIEPELSGFDPAAALSYVEVHLDRDFSFVVASRDQAEALVRAAPEQTSVRHHDDGTATVTRRRGSVIRVPRALRLSRNVLGQVPSGWDPVRLGIPPDMAQQVDRTTLFNLVATAEAFLAAGLEPEEIYAYLHPSRVGSTQGSAMGGLEKLRRMYHDFREGAERQTDCLQETLINVVAGWTVQSYLGSYGPMSFPVAACATAAVSLSDGVDKIRAGHADVVLTGGTDDSSLEFALGFGDMAATSSTQKAEGLGLDPGETCRPNDRRRHGFVEAHGAGALIICRASVAISMGLPVYGVVAYAGTFGDGLQRSVPAPGLGALSAGAGEPDTDGDACHLAQRRSLIAKLEGERASLSAALGEAAADTLIREGRRAYGHHFHHDDPAISPLRGALAVLGLTPDDIAVVSKHDTSTQANDLNENLLHHELQQRLGRTPDLPLLVISQKSVTGHSKGAAAAWQLCGLLQAMAEGVVPGNRNLEDPDPAMERFSMLAFTDGPLAMGSGGLRAGLVTSLGFGHVSALVAIAHPFHFWRMLSSETRSLYAARLRHRLAKGSGRLQRVVGGHEPLFRLRTQRPFAGKDGGPEQQQAEMRMLLDSGARLGAGS